MDDTFIRQEIKLLAVMMIAMPKGNQRDGCNAIPSGAEKKRGKNSHPPGMSWRFSLKSASCFVLHKFPHPTLICHLSLSSSSSSVLPGSRVLICRQCMLISRKGGATRSSSIAHVKHPPPLLSGCCFNK